MKIGEGMPTSPNWTRQQLLVAFHLYTQMPFGKLHSRNAEIIKYAKLIGRTPDALAMKLTNIASRDPEITSTGRTGLRGVSAADVAMWAEMQSDWGCFAIEMHQAVNALGTDSPPGSSVDDESLSDENVDYTGNTKTTQTTARIGQSFFRRAVLSAYNYRCCITGLSVPQLLIASHIVPWCVQSENRLNPRNGLCLSMLHDKAFDSGMITVAEDMTIKVSRKLCIKSDHFFEASVLAYDGTPLVEPKKFAPLAEFLSYHRQHVFEKFGARK